MNCSGLLTAAPNRPAYGYEAWPHFERQEVATQRLRCLPEDITEIGRRLGADILQSSRWKFNPAWPSSVIEGFFHARRQLGRRHLGDRFSNKLLQLRLNALQRGRIVSDSVDYAYLQAIDVAICPVTRQALTHGELIDSDWSVDRLNNRGGYVRNNLDVMSVKANRAKGAKQFDEVLALSEGDEEVDGLQPFEWLRVAVLMLGPCFVEAPSLAPTLPMVAPMPQYSLRLAMQQVQHVLTEFAQRNASKNQLVKVLGRASERESARMQLDLFACRLQTAIASVDDRRDAWLQAGVMQSLEKWRNGLNDREWALTAQLAAGLSGSTSVLRQAIERWSLKSGGKLEAVGQSLRLATYA